MVAEVQRYGVTVVCYTWNLMRAVLDTPGLETPRYHPVRAFIGSGMSAELARRVALAEAGGRPLRARQPATRHAGVSRLGELGVHGLMFLLVPRVTTRPSGACGCSSVGRAQPCQG